MRRQVPTPHILTSPAATRHFGRRFVTTLKPGDIVLLEGPLGSGKTTLVQGVGKALGVQKHITSPTFVIRKRYQLPRPYHGIAALNHIDAYRITTAAGLRGALDDWFRPDDEDVWFIEWGKHLRSAFRGRRTLLVRLSHRAQLQREVLITTLLPKRRTKKLR